MGSNRESSKTTNETTKSDCKDYKNGINESKKVAENHVGNLNGNGTKSGASHLKSPFDVPIAICGMGLRLPGGIRTDSDLYDFLVKKKDARTEVPKSRYNIDAYHSRHNKPNTVVSRYGYFLEDVDLGEFDISMFSMRSAEASHLDPSQRLLLEVVREALESAGEAKFRGQNIGSYVAVYSEDWQELQNRDVLDQANPYELTGKLDFMLSNRISYEYDLKGPSLTMKTACSSSGYALHSALQAIRLGEIPSAIVAGANLLMSPNLAIKMSASLALSPDGSSKTFDASADGYGRGEGITCLYIKRLEDAIRDGNPVRGIIRASSTNADGRASGGLSVPNPIAHEAMIRQTYANAGLNFDDTAMVECHGTGTAVGDPLEVAAIANCFGNRGVYIGSVKPNLGHSEGASAITSILKAILSLEHQTIIPNIKFVTPNPDIPWSEAKLEVPTEPLPWPKDRQERMSVNSFGIGGSNVHFVIDSARSFGLSRVRQPEAGAQPKTVAKRLLLFSANSKESLTASTDNCKQYLENHAEDLDSVAYTLAERREHLKLRAFSVTNGTAPMEITTAGDSHASMAKKIAFIFTGQGAQWVHMGRELIHDIPSFRDSIRQMDRILRSLEHAPSFSLEDTLLHCTEKGTISQPELSQPLCTALQVAIVDLLAAWGLFPSAVIGHSSGEIGAAYASGALSMREAIIVAFYRGYACAKARQASPGGMAAIGLGRESVIPYLIEGVSIACENSNKSVTLSGAIEPLEKCMAAIKQSHAGALVRRLEVDVAYHSEHMQSIGETYENLIRSHLKAMSPHTLFISSVHAKPIESADSFGAQYWRRNLEKSVLFHSAVTSLLHESPDTGIHLEIGPHSALAGPLRQIYAEKQSSAQYFSVLTRGKNDTDAYLETMGQLFCAEAHVHQPIPVDARVLPQYPTYAWNHQQSHWTENRLMKSWRFKRHAHHDLLGSRTLESSDLEPSWRNILRVVDVPWLRDHVVGHDTVFPAAAYVAMAGEAVSQLYDNGDVSYTVRKIHLNNAMLLQDDESLEIVTTLRPQKLTSKQDSKWYEFTVASHNASGWIRHCHGLVTNGGPEQLPVGKAEAFLRKVSPGRWYKALARIGLNYGPRFAGLHDITASIVEKASSARVTDKQDDYESRYALHPSTMDIIFQSWSVAQTNGIYRGLTRLLLPTYIDEIFIGDSRSATLDLVTSDDGERAYSRASVDGEVRFLLRGLEGTPLDNDNNDNSNQFQAQHLQWKPEFEFADPAALVKPSYRNESDLSKLERLFVLCALESKEKTSGVVPSQPHFAFFLSWLEKQVIRFRQPNYPMVQDSASLVDLHSEDRQQLLKDCVEDLRGSRARPLAEAIWRCYQNLPAIIGGEINFLDLLLEDKLLQEIYDWMNCLQDLTPMFSLLGNSRPQLRILEVGAGTGGLTEKILQCLKSDYGERLYLRYTYTDISTGFFVQAQERFKDYDEMEYKVLDISRDPLEQGFNRAEYDLVVASNVIHATPCLVDTLENCRTLLRPNHGRLFLQELSPTTKSANFVFGLFSGWWLGQSDGRVDEPIITPEMWDCRLREAGFDGIDSLMGEEKQQFHMNANFMARPTVNTAYPDRVILLTGTEGPGILALATQKELEKRGCQVDFFVWGEGSLPVDQDLISFVDIEGPRMPLLQDVSDTDLNYLIQIVDNAAQSTLLWLTNPAQIHCKDPHAAQMLGFARTVRAELAMDFATLELEHTKTGAAAVITDVLRKLQRTRLAEDDGDLDQDMEFAWVDGAIQISRFHWFPVCKALTETTGASRYKHLVVGQRGMLQSLQWRGLSLAELKGNEVRVRTNTIGMNFRELMSALGIINIDLVEGRDGGINASGAEAAGRVTAVGSNVSHLRVGDRVMCMGSTSTGFATEVNRPTECCVKIPDSLDDEGAASMPVVYFTVLLCLVEKAQLKRGQTLLIHSAAGGVGIAAIHMARWIGADIYVTTGTPEKAAFLTTELGVPRERIFASRDDSFVADIMAATGGKGVDVVLNSLSGELLHASWRCVAAYGSMVEIGKRDVLGHGMLDMSPFAANRTFSCIDASTAMLDLPRLQRGMRLIVDLYEQGHIHPIRPVTLFEASRVEDAYRYMQQGLHIGKIIIRFPSLAEEKNSDLTLRLAPSIPDPIFRHGVSYLLVGGTGGLGKAIASWMVSHGARNLIFLSRSAGQSSDDQAFFTELKEGGCHVHCYAGDVADATLVQRVVKEASLPIAGVLQMAMVLRDVGVRDMDTESWVAATHPKVKGTWNLHRLLPKNLDFFVLFSSIAGLFGYFGQANYASANTFLDAFVQYRQAKGQVASVIDLGPIDEVGYVAVTSGALANANSHSNLVSEQDFLDLLQLAVGSPPEKLDTQIPGSFHNPNQYGQVPFSKLSISDPSNSAWWKREPRMAIYRNIERVSIVANDSNTSNALRTFLSSLMAEPDKLDNKASLDLVTGAIGERLSTFLMRTEQDLDLTKTLSALGVDSLVGIELRNWWKQSLGVEVSALELMNGGTVEQLGALAVERLKTKYCSKNVESHESK